MRSALMARPHSSSGISASRVQQIDTGVVLSVTPPSKSGGLVRLEVSQQLSQAVPSAGAVLDPIL
jgi:type II secretory pathway component GspD/PulD (secretin)